MRPNVSISIEFGYGLTCYKRGLQGLKYGGGRQLLSVSGVLVGKSFDLSNNVVVERECTSVSWSLLFNYVNFQLSRSAIFLQTGVVLEMQMEFKRLPSLVWIWIVKWWHSKCVDELSVGTLRRHKLVIDLLILHWNCLEA